MAKIQKTDKSWKLSGDLTVECAPGLVLESAHLPIQGKLLIDFSSVEHVDTATLSLIFEWMREAKKKRCTLKFAHLPENLKSLMALYGVSELVPH